ncbi:MAG: extracellular solute-binding protein [Magnetococcus sp. WYHC-3]
MITNIFTVLGLGLALLWLPGGTAHAADLTVAGSTTVQKRILEPLAADIKAVTGIDVKVLGVGSGGGFTQLMEGKVPASVASSPMASLLKKNGLADDGTYQEHVLAMDVIVPIVHKDNPVTTLTWAQLADLNTGKVTNWKELGGEDQAVVVVTSHEGSATREVFQEMVMKKAGYAEKKREVRSTRQEVDMVAKYKGGIGAVSKSFVEMNPGQVKVVATDEISRPLCFITKGAPTPEVKALLDFLGSAEAKAKFQ